LTPRRIVVAGADHGAGHERVAESLADALRRHPSGGARVLQLDLLSRCAPRAAQLAALAWRGGEPFFPDGEGELSSMAAGETSDPLLRELVSGGIATAEAALVALEPDLVVAVHPVSAGIAAEVSQRCGFRVAAVVPDLVPERLWVHPGINLWFVAGPEARDELVRRGVEWSRVVVSGVPVEALGEREATRRRLAGAGLQDRFTALVAGPAGAGAAVDPLASSGVQVVQVGVEGGRSAPLRRPLGAPVVSAPSEESHAALLSAADVLVCGPCGAFLWEALAAGVPLIVVGPVGAMERASVDLLVTAGAAIPARDGEDAARRVAYLASHAGRLSDLRAASSLLGRPQAARAVSERLLALVE
jgi:processive 1,2-diacylglycerol beta-glucosyltransferase